MWKHLIQIYWQICLFRRSPADSPYSPLLLFFMSMFFLVLVFLQWWLVNQAPSHVYYGAVLLLGGIILASYALYTWALLLIYRNRSRFIQTLTSLFACHGIIHLLALPILVLMPLLSTQGIYFFNVIFLVLSLTLSIWQFMISAHIYRHALQVGTVGSLVASFGLIAVNLLMISFG